MASAEYVVGIDGGGTGCRVSVCDRAGNRLGQAVGGPANYATDSVSAIQNVLAAVHNATRSVVGAPPDLTQCVAHIGLAGVMDKKDAGNIAAAMPFARVGVTDDRATTVTGALRTADGVLVSVGTGSFVAAQRGGVQRFLGGWGHVLGDQASGAWLGLQVMRLTALANDGLMDHSDLTLHISGRCGETSIKLLSFVKDAGPPDYAALAPAVIEAANAGDRHGTELMQQGADYLSSCLKTLDFTNSEALCLTGGIGPHYAAYLDPRAQSCLRPPEGTALDGAIHLARELL